MNRIVILVLAATLAGCAAAPANPPEDRPRLLLPEDPADRRRALLMCELEGCYAMPVSVWSSVLELLRAAGYEVRDR